MRKVIYTEWVKGVETEEYKNAPVEERAIFPSHYHFIKGTNCNVEKEGLFHGFYPSFDFIGSNHEIASCTVAVIEDKDGKILQLNTEVIHFIDNPEDEQCAEFTNTANAILQGLAQRNGWYWQGSGIDENLTGFLPSDFAKMYYELISELKKHKP
jgi:hypothetical protein